MTAFAEVSKRIQLNIPGTEAALEEFSSWFPLSRAWVEYHWAHGQKSQSKPLLFGARVSLLEAGTSWAIGSNRGAAANLRSYTENIVSYLFYKDHPIEYKMVEDGREELMLPKAIKAYAAKIDPGFDSSYSALFKQSKRGTEYYYTVISDFIHAHPKFLVGAKALAELVVSVPIDPGFKVVCENTDEFISDIYVVLHRKSWDTIPQNVRDSISTRLDKKLAKFLAG